MKGFYSIILLVISNSFMTLAWYGHLKFKDWNWFMKSGLIGFILISWGIAFFEYCFQVPANRIGFKDFGGPFSMLQLKVIQEVVSLLVFSFFAVVVLKQGGLQWNHLLGFFFLVLAVFFVFIKT
ncbi:MAG: DMT family protein [Bacteroidetes bacterium]|nr:DMT family protein [Bacteroidota bacterium]